MHSHGTKENERIRWEFVTAPWKSLYAFINTLIRPIDPDQGINFRNSKTRQSDRRSDWASTSRINTATLQMPGKSPKILKSSFEDRLMLQKIRVIFDKRVRLGECTAERTAAENHSRPLSSLGRLKTETALSSRQSPRNLSPTCARREGTSHTSTAATTHLLSQLPMKKHKNTSVTKFADKIPTIGTHNPHEILTTS